MLFFGQGRLNPSLLAAWAQDKCRGLRINAGAQVGGRLTHLNHGERSTPEVGRTISGGMPPTRVPDRLPLPGDNEAHVWTAFLSESLPALASHEGLLSPEEKQRAGRFLRPDDRSRYIAAHGILRQLLGRYLSIAPAELAFGQNAFGKPLLTAGTGRTAVSFNLAHSGDLILYAFASDYRVGIDVEAINTDLDVTELAQSQFSLHEIQTLQAMMPSERTSAFFRCWTRKEAYLKARGEGLVFPLGQFSVSFAADVPPGIRWAADDPTVAARWSMFDLTPAPGYAGAIVVEHPSIHLVSRPWGPFAE